MFRRKHTADTTNPPAPGSVPPVDDAREWELVVVDPRSGEHVDVGVRLTFRDLEILGSAGRFYGDAYSNEERPAEQVAWRKERARLVGGALWDAATDRVGIQGTGA